MLYDRIVDNKEIGRTIWKICTAFNNDLYYTALKALHYIEWFVQRWMIYTSLNDLNYVEWFVLRWMICTKYAAQLRTSLGKVKGKGPISPDQWMEKLRMRNLSWSMNRLEIFKVLNWLMSQYRKTIVAEFFFKIHSPVLEMILFWK